METKILISGIYCITFKDFSLKYIGSSINLSRRYDYHISRLRKGNHNNKRLQNVFNTQGLNSLNYTILETVDNTDFLNKKVNKQQFQEILFEKEQKYLDKYFAQEYIKNPRDNRFFELLLNNSVLARSNKSELSLSREKEIHQFDKSGKFLNSFYNSEIAQICTGIDAGSIKKVCYGKRFSAGGFIWSYNLISIPYKNNINRKINQFDLQKKFIKSYESIADAARQTGIKIRKYNSKSKTFGGYFFLFDEEDFPLFKRKTKFNVS